MAFRAMLDTNILSALMRDPRGPVRQRLQEFGASDVCMSIISACELRYGAERRKSAKVERQVELISRSVPIVRFEESADGFYGRIRASLETVGRPIGPNDLFIAAHALALNLTLITANVREFSRVPDLRVDNWLD